jgi:hypothetical protein
MDCEQEKMIGFRIEEQSGEGEPIPSPGVPSCKSLSK